MELEEKHVGKAIKMKGINVNSIIIIDVKNSKVFHNFLKKIGFVLKGIN
jgi:hypothetical protein